ncbi:hypothetical protein [Sporomusa sp. GT1]|nr:hypothetical protein [Sporomusa sp. GT1]
MKVYNYDPFDNFFTYDSKADLDPITQKPMFVNAGFKLTESPVEK